MFSGISLKSSFVTLSLHPRICIEVCHLIVKFIYFNKFCSYFYTSIVFMNPYDYTKETCYLVHPFYFF